MVQSPSWEANWFAASQEIPRISRNPKVHYRTHKRSSPVPILDQPNPVHIPTSHILKIYPNIIHPSTSRAPQWSPSPRFPHQDPIHPLSSPIRATCSAHLILLERVRTYITTIWIQFSQHRWQFWPSLRRADSSTRGVLPSARARARARVCVCVCLLVYVCVCVYHWVLSRATLIL